MLRFYVMLLHSTGAWTDFFFFFFEVEIVNLACRFSIRDVNWENSVIAFDRTISNYEILM